MNYRNTKRTAVTPNRRTVLITGLIIAVLLLGGVSALLIHKYNTSNKSAKSTAYGKVGKVNYTPAKPSDSATNETRKDSSSPSSTLSNGTTAPSNTASAPFSVQIVSANVNNGNLHVGNQVNGITTGKCSLTAAQASKQITLASSDVQQDVNVYDCGVYNISTNRFPASGDWKLTLSVTNNGSTATNSVSVKI